MKNKLRQLGILFLFSAFFGIVGCSHTKAGHSSHANMLGVQDHPILKAPEDE